MGKKNHFPKTTFLFIYPAGLVMILVLLVIFSRRGGIEKEQSPTTAPMTYPTPSEPSVVKGGAVIKGDLLITFNERLSPSELSRIMRKLNTMGAIKYHSYPSLRMGLYELTLSRGMPSMKAIAGLRNDPAIQSVAPNVMKKPGATQISTLSAAERSVPAVK